jgi:DNA-binding NtrC family response regulator
MTPDHIKAESRPRLLFVDDEQRVLNSMRIMFRRQFELYLASGGEDALAIIRENDIDVIVADHRMPYMTGVEVLTQVRSISPRTVRILLTGYADLDAVEGSINDGEVFRFLTKPCAPEQLKETISLAARLARATTTQDSAGTELGAEDVEIILEGSDSTEVEAVLGTLPMVAAPCVDSAEDSDDDPANRILAAPLQPTPSSVASVKAFDPGSTDALHIVAPVAKTRLDQEHPPAARRNTGLGVIVFSEDASVIETVQKAVRGRIPVYAASNVVKVVKLLAEHQPGVLLTDVSEDRATIQSMTARLKQHLPELVTIAISQHRDVLDMVWLINHGQIFRFLRKPLSPGRCAICLQAALKHHRMLLKNPDLVKRYEVDETTNTGIVEGMLSKLRNVRRLWASA